MLFSVVFGCTLAAICNFKIELCDVTLRLFPRMTFKHANDKMSSLEKQYIL